MRIRYLNNGNFDHVDRNVGQSLIRAGIAEEVSETKPGQSSLDALREHQRAMNPPAPPDQPRWSVEYLGLVQKAWFVVLRVGAYAVKFGGDPKLVNARRTWEGGGMWLSGFGRECPESVVKEYAARYKNARESERWYPPVSATSSDYAANTAMATELTAVQTQMKANDAALADFVRPEESRAPRVIGGPDASEVTYERGNPGF